ncbi:MAG: F0F1 ATP synthase subunit gamma [Pseudomonadales bacterium]|nr:F0F1 ATP synthase subunit gamma [Pseudomonadales bacterium]
MSESMINLRRKIKSAGDLQSVARTMKALAASNIGQYEQAVRALADYYRAIELGLGVALRHYQPGTRVETETTGKRPGMSRVDAIVFGSDQGLVGQFNDAVANHAGRILAELPGTPRVWAVGERVHARLQNLDLVPLGLFGVPGSVKGITPLVRQIQLDSDIRQAEEESSSVHVFYNHPLEGNRYEPTHLRLLPLDQPWQQKIRNIDWPGGNLPELMSPSVTLRSLIHEHLFISLFRACAESLASENASRLAAMERADRNIDELLEHLQTSFHHLRQSNIDEELFDVSAGYESLTLREESHSDP